MAVEKPELSESLIGFIRCSPMFFIATAPSGQGGHINCSPRPLDWSFFIDSPKRVGWFDLVGSGIETIAHLKDNGRIVLMFCSFGARPLILRVHGSGAVYEPGDDVFEASVSSVDSSLGVRAVVIVEVERVSTSCGYGVPVMEFVSHRPTINEWLKKKGDEGLVEYRMRNNLISVDGLAGLDSEKLR